MIQAIGKEQQDLHITPDLKHMAGTILLLRSSPYELVKGCSRELTIHDRYVLQLRSKDAFLRGPSVGGHS